MDRISKISSEVDEMLMKVL